MSFKFIYLFIIFLVLIGCGVKSQPVKPSETAISSYIQSYTGTEEVKTNPKKP